jgi:hypothetical protein
MVSTNVGRSGLALMLGTGSKPGCIAVGTGSGTPAATNVKLVSEVLRRTCSSIDTSTVYNCTYTGDFSSQELSGLAVQEFGVFVSGALNTGSCWQRDMFPVVNFDGSLELQIQVTFSID